MGEANYSIEFVCPASAEKVFHALTKNIHHWWTTNIEGVSEVGAQLKFTFGSTYKVMQVEKLVPQKCVVWKCTEAHIDLAELKNKSEWVGTTLRWDIAEVNTNQTEIHFQHIGLTPEVECYGICSMAWESFLTKSFQNYLLTGKGNPYTK